jgi:hypothetical protein
MTLYCTFSVRKTAASIAPGLAIDGTARGNIAVLLACVINATSCSGLLSPNMSVGKIKPLSPPFLTRHNI